MSEQTIELKLGIVRIVLFCILAYLTLCMYVRTRWEHRIRGGYCQRCGFQYETCMVTMETCAHMQLPLVHHFERLK